MVSIYRTVRRLMDYQIEYENFIKWITNPAAMGLMGPIVYSREEAAFAKLFAAYLNCRHYQMPPNKPFHADRESRASLK